MVAATQEVTVRCVRGFHAHCRPEKHGPCQCKCHSFESTRYDKVRSLLFVERDRCADCDGLVYDGRAYCEDCIALMNVNETYDDETG